MSQELPTLALAEDNPDDVFFMKRALKAAEVLNPLIILPNGRQVLEYLGGKGPYAERSLYPLPKLLFLDLKLPLLNGFEVLEWIRSRPETRSLAVIILTTSGEYKDINKAYQMGANSFLIKPSGAENLANQMRAMKQFWLDHNTFSQP